MEKQKNTVYEQPRAASPALNNEPKPSSFLAWSICNTVCCNLIFGLIALAFSVSTLSEIKHEKALKNSKKAKIFNCIATVVGILTYIAVVIITVLSRKKS